MTLHRSGYAAAVQLRAALRLRAVPPASRAATAIATRRAHGPPLTPEPLRPLTGQRRGQHPEGPLRRQARGARHYTTKIKSLQPSLYGFRGLPRSRLASLEGS
jgi:hypothetical protein